MSSTAFIVRGKNSRRAAGKGPHDPHRRPIGQMRQGRPQSTKISFPHDRSLVGRQDAAVAIRANGNRAISALPTFSRLPSNRRRQHPIFSVTGIASPPPPSTHASTSNQTLPNGSRPHMLPLPIVAVPSAQSKIAHRTKSHVTNLSAHLPDAIFTKVGPVA